MSEIDRKWSIWEGYKDEDKKETFKDKLAEIIKLKTEEEFLQLTVYSHFG